MKIIYPPTLLSSLQNKHLLLDANVFRDAGAKPTDFRVFFNNLKKAEVTLTTIDFVKYELLTGSANETKYIAKEALINDIIDVYLPIIPQTFQLVYEVIKSYGIDGSSLSITALFLGATLMQYKENIYLMTSDTTDFIQSIFDLSFVINVPYTKGIFTYGIYQYVK